MARRNFRGEVSSPSSLRSQQSPFDAAAPITNPPTDDGESSYYVFLQKFPLESSFKMIFHTEVIVCPRETFAKDQSFLDTLDGLLDTLMPSRFDVHTKDTTPTKESFAHIKKRQWKKQSEPGCVQLGYGGANCGMGCCGSPHLHDNRNYALNSQVAVIDNAMGEDKELYFYGVSRGDDAIDGNDAYKAVCHGHMNSIEMGDLPKCVSDWAGRDYNPLTNNCNTFTSTILKCIYGLSDAKPKLGVSDLISVTCPSEKKDDGTDVDQCLIPTNGKAPSLSME